MIILDISQKMQWKQILHWQKPAGQATSCRIKNVSFTGSNDCSSYTCKVSLKYPKMTCSNHLEYHHLEYVWDIVSIPRHSLPCEKSFKNVDELLCWHAFAACNSALLLIFLQNLVCNDKSLNFTGPLVDFSNAGIAVVSLSRHVCYITHSPQHLNGLYLEKDRRVRHFILH